MKTFKLIRKEDVSKVSGTGIVAEGVVFKNGQVALSWYGSHRTIELAPTIQDIIDIHGHDGLTEVVYDMDLEPICVSCQLPTGPDKVSVCKECMDNWI